MADVSNERRPSNKSNNSDNIAISSANDKHESGKVLEVITDVKRRANLEYKDGKSNGLGALTTLSSSSLMWMGKRGNGLLRAVKPRHFAMAK